MATFLLKSATFLVTILSLTLVSPYDECADLFFTPAWQKCFQNKFKFNWAFNPLGDRLQAFDFPAMPNVNDLFDQVNSQGGFPGSSISSSSFASSSGGGSTKSVISSNGRTWVVETDGIPVSTTDNGTIRRIKVSVGKPVLVNNVVGDNSLQVNLQYGDETVRTTHWVKVTVDSSSNVKDLKVDTANGILYIEGPV